MPNQQISVKEKFGDDWAKCLYTSGVLINSDGQRGKSTIHGKSGNIQDKAAISTECSAAYMEVTKARFPLPELTARVDR